MSEVQHPQTSPCSGIVEVLDDNGEVINTVMACADFAEAA